MAVADDLQERERQAGNTEDSYDPSQRHYDEAFNKIAAAEEEKDFDQIIANNYGDGASDEKIDTHGDTIKRNYNSDAADVRDRENHPKYTPGDTDSNAKDSGSKTRSKLLKGIQKYGASGGIAGLIIGMFGGASIILAPGALLVSLEKALTNDGSDATRMNIIMRRAYMGSLLGKNNCTASICKKVTTMSTAQKERWEKLGFKIDSTDAEGRHKVTKITTPDGVEIDSASKWQQYSENTVEGRKHANRVLNVRAAYFQNSKFNKVLGKFNLAKSKVMASSKDRDKAARTATMGDSFNETTGAEKDRESRISKIRSSIKEKAKAPASTAKGKLAAKGINPTTSAVAAACTAYDITRISTATVKAIWISELVAFAFPFVQAAAQIEDQGNVDPELVEYLADRLTWYHTEDYAEQLVASGEDKDALQKVNKTAMDAQGMQFAIFGDFSKLQEITKAYTTAAMQGALVGGADDVVRLFQNNFPGGKEGIRAACLTGNLAGLASSATCATGGPVSIAICAAVAGAAIAVVGVWGDDIIMYGVEQMIEPAIELIADANLTSELRGVDAGNAIAAGVGLMLAKGSMGYGLKPAASLTAVNSFIAQTDDINYTYTTQLALDEAKEKPFDTSNPYSFTGQIASAFNPYRSNDGTAFSQILNGFAFLSNTLTKTPSANALYHQPSNMTLTDESAKNRINCPEGQGCRNDNVDADMADIGAVSDWSNRMVGVVSDTVINKAAAQANGSEQTIAEVIEYMLENEYIKDNGSVNEEKEDNKYRMYKDYCTEDREYPLGTTVESIMGTGNFFETLTGVSAIGAEEDDKWFTGENCVGTDPKIEQMLDYFAMYFNICESQFATAEGTENCWDDTQALGNVTPSTGDWVIPTSGPCVSPYGQRWGKLHAGIDISPPSGTPIVAPTDMTITYSGYNSGGYGNMVTAKADDGTEYSFRFGHMLNSDTPAAGTKVKKGQQIGLVGSTGNSTGPHLHFEIFPPGGNPATFSGAVDPVPVMAQNGVNISCS